MLYCVGYKVLEELAQKSSGCPILGCIQGQSGWGFGDPDLFRDVSVYGKTIGTR